ncbi:MAG TPA: LuxR C-terminal-related transcriptional regulator [Acidimicrobiales bacterium]|nr:LuxR C-terminal-related transcriptional regulator [Acidimicrobiales bacterium]
MSAGAEHYAGTRAVPTYVLGSDPISQAGLIAQLRSVASLRIVDEPERARVAVLVVDEVDDDAARSIRKVLRTGCAQVAAIVTVLDDAGVLRAVEAGACTILRRSEATPEQLAGALVAAVEGHGSLPPDLLGSLLSQVGALQRNVLQPRGLLLNGFTERELEVLRLLADGLDTAEVAAKLSYSERTVKGIVHDVVTRYNLRNRCHAVAYACRAGVI